MEAELMGKNYSYAPPVNPCLPQNVTLNLDRFVASPSEIQIMHVCGSSPHYPEEGRGT